MGSELYRLLCRRRRLWVIRDRVQPAARSAMAAMRRKRKQVHGISGCHYRPLRVDVSALGVIQAPEPEPRIMRYELREFEWAAIKPVLGNKPRGVPRVNDRRVLDGVIWILRSGAPWRDPPEKLWALHALLQSLRSPGRLITRLRFSSFASQSETQGRRSLAPLVSDFIGAAPNTSRLKS